MEHQPAPLSQEESIRIITSMIATARGAIAHNGFDFIFWGWTLIIASVAHFAFLMLQTPFDPSFAYFIMPLGGIYMWIHHRNEHKTVQVQTHVDLLMPYVWGSFGAMMFIGMFFAGAAQTSPMPFILLFVGTATFISGGAFKFTPLIVGGVLFWIFAVISFFLPITGQIGIQALSMVLGYLIPGYMLVKKSSTENVQRA